MSRSEARRRHKLYERARRRWREANPHRKFEITPAAIYLAPPELRPTLGEERSG